MDDTGPERAQPRWRERLLVGVLVTLAAALVVVLLNASEVGFRARGYIDDASDLVGLGGPDYALSLNDDGEPVHWDPCRPIYYTVNPLHAPSNWEAVVAEAVKLTAEASGFDLRDTGTTYDRHLSPAPRGKHSPVLIGWASSSEAPTLTGGRLGYGQVATVTGSEEAVAGVIWLDAGAYSQMPHAGRTKDEVLILAHELGHVLGLDHVDDTDELMYPRYLGQDGFGSGDIDGFEVLRDQPCQIDTSTEA